MYRDDSMLNEESRLDRGTYTTMRVIHMGIKNEDDDGGDWRPPTHTHKHTTITTHNNNNPGNEKHVSTTRRYR